ncbi:flagellar hook protein FlgE [Siccirubricoccus sp. KC 17139]|uniref:Flagellar hook protein FlgE n=1 Tax=Siccirubricoccus soli TaxID=2899147 RepID=A0ABT1D540_9PROT|nr:flagellar hook protein FlgE [Siccirubricoccus soli]MCO6416989.1 flagellar hook protein FlgE [Siccirubricoccus soli]MCP2683124.1 flagellar hook protein FlgE [Siccirubricoccus soli]
MSLFGSLTAAISGLTAQSRALGHISDNVANSQTVGYKRVDTNFVSYLTQSSASTHLPGATIARPSYTNSAQGTVEQSENPLAMAISGQGFFAVAAATGTNNGQPVFDDRQFFTRAGDFGLDQDGYLVNGSGYYLKGWPADPNTGNPDRTNLTPIRVSQQVFNPVATTEIELGANLPSATVDNDSISTQAELYDSLGTLHTVNLTFTKNTSNEWTLSIDVPDAVTATAGTVDLQFGTAASATTTPGTLGNMLNATGTVVLPPSNNPGDLAAVSFDVDFGQGTQTVSLNFGAFAEAQGLTQYSSETFEIRNRNQNGVPLGSYSGLSIAPSGDISVNYDNGQSRVVARIPLVAFNDPDALQRLDGQAFMRTPESGEARITDASSNGVGKLVVSSVERSNVDIANEFTKLILAQRAYTANTKVVTTSDEMLQDTINMRR